MKLSSMLGAGLVVLSMGLWTSVAGAVPAGFATRSRQTVTGPVASAAGGGAKLRETAGSPDKKGGSAGKGSPSGGKPRATTPR